MIREEKFRRLQLYRLIGFLLGSYIYPVRYFMYILASDTLGVRHKSSLQSPSHAFRTFCNDVRAPTASQIGARGKMRELESTAASRARGVPVLAAPLHNACPGASRNAAIPSLVLAQQMRAAQQGQHQRCTACTAQHMIFGRARACGIASSMCIQTPCDLEK